MQFKVLILLSDDKLFQYSFIIYSSVAMNVSQQVKKKKRKKSGIVKEMLAVFKNCVSSTAVMICVFLSDAAASEA